MKYRIAVYIAGFIIDSGMIIDSAHTDLHGTNRLSKNQVKTFLVKKTPKNAAVF